MTTSELISYIRNQIKNNISNETIISKLTQAGWHREDIDEGFLAVHLEYKPEVYIPETKKEISDIDTTKIVKKSLDQYREPVTDDIVDIDAPDLEVHKKETPKIETPKIEVFNVVEPIIETPKIEASKVETFKTELPVVDIPKIETFTPIEIKAEEPQIEVYKPEISKVETEETKIPEVEIPKVLEQKITEPKAEEPQIEVYKPEISVPEARKTEIEEVKILEVEVPKLEEQVIEIPKGEVFTPVVTDVKKEEIELPVPESSVLEETKTEEPKPNTYKIWTPMRVPLKENLQADNKELESKIEDTEIIVQNQELPVGVNNNLEQFENKVEINKDQELLSKEEFIPTLKPKSDAEPLFPVKDTTESKEDIHAAFNETSKNYLFENLPKTAMLSSYENDFSAANKEERMIVKKRAPKIIKWVIIIFAFLIIVGGVAWAFIGGFINIENMPFVKKDPKVLLLNNSKVLSSLKSYKTETNIKITSPSFANITSGIISGEAIPSLDKDYISINSSGLINQNEQGLLSSNSILLQGSFMEKDIKADIKNINSDLFITSSDFKQMIAEASKEPQTVKINEKQFDVVPSLFPSEFEVELKKINLFKMLSNGILSYINNETINVYDEFINNVKITEKGKESIKGIDTYHYSINADRPLIKKLLNKIADDFTSNLSSEDTVKLTDILGSTTVDSFDVWVGVGDNNIYQYNVELSAPLSKILSFEDKSIGDNQVKFSWKTTYFDFNIVNDITMPEISTPITDFVKDINETKIKNDVLSFKQLATNLFNAEGNYGPKSNPLGSCMTPVSGSLFSPIGHTKGSNTAVGSISELLNKVLNTTKNEGLCYSTPKAWSFTIPISDTYTVEAIPVVGGQSFFCIDNTGTSKSLITPPKGVVCE